MTRDQLLEHARQQALRVADKFGMELPQVDPKDVPTDVRPLVPYANVLGVGDDPLRGEIVRAVGQEYLDLVREAVRDHRDALRAWLAGEPHDGNYREQYAALDWMLRALGIRP